MSSPRILTALNETAWSSPRRQSYNALSEEGLTAEEINNAFPDATPSSPPIAGPSRVVVAKRRRSTVEADQGAGPSSSSSSPARQKVRRVKSRSPTLTATASTECTRSTSWPRVEEGASGAGPSTRTQSGDVLGTEYTEAAVDEPTRFIARTCAQIRQETSDGGEGGGEGSVLFSDQARGRARVEDEDETWVGTEGTEETAEGSAPDPEETLVGQDIMARRKVQDIDELEEQEGTGTFDPLTEGTASTESLQKEGSTEGLDDPLPLTNMTATERTSSFQQITRASDYLPRPYAPAFPPGGVPSAEGEGEGEGEDSYAAGQCVPEVESTFFGSTQHQAESSRMATEAACRLEQNKDKMSLFLDPPPLQLDLDGNVDADGDADADEEVEAEVDDACEPNEDEDEDAIAEREAEKKQRIHQPFIEEYFVHDHDDVLLEDEEDEEEEGEDEDEEEVPFETMSYHSGDSDLYEMDHRPILERTEVKRDIREFVSSLNTLERNREYKVVDRLGEGTFSSVYLAKDVYYNRYDNSFWTGRGTTRHADQINRKRYDKPIALKKVLATSSPNRIENELAILEALRGCRNVTTLITAFREDDQIVIVLPYHQSDDFRHFYRHMDAEHIRLYMRSLMQALKDIHSRGIVHRDVKPANFLFDYEHGTGALCDFGLAERYQPAHKTMCQHQSAELGKWHGQRAKTSDTSTVEQAVYEARKRNKLPENKIGFQLDDKRPSTRANRAGTRGFRAPEVLLKCPDQTFAIDVWSAGVMLLSMITHKFPVFNSNDDIEALLEIAAIFGRLPMERCAMLHNRTLVSNLPTLDSAPGDIQTVILKLNPHIYTPPFPNPTRDQAKRHIESMDDAMDLCAHLLRLDCTKRATASQALRHRFLRESGGKDRLEQEVIPPTEGKCGTLHSISEDGKKHQAYFGNDLVDMPFGAGNPPSRKQLCPEHLNYQQRKLENPLVCSKQFVRVESESESEDEYEDVDEDVEGAEEEEEEGDDVSEDGEDTDKNQGEVIDHPSAAVAAESRPNHRQETRVASATSNADDLLVDPPVPVNVPVPGRTQTSSNTVGRNKVQMWIDETGKTREAMLAKDLNRRDDRDRTRDRRGSGTSTTAAAKTAQLHAHKRLADITRSGPDMKNENAASASNPTAQEPEVAGAKKVNVLPALRNKRGERERDMEDEAIREAARRRLLV